MGEAADRLRARLSGRLVPSTDEKDEQEDPGPFGGAFLSGAGRLASRLVNPLVDVPELPGGIIGEGIERGLEELTSPVSIASVALAPFTGGGSIAGAGALRAGARVAGREVVTGLAAQGGAQLAQEGLDRAGVDNGIVRLGATLGAGVVGGGLAAKGLGASFNNRMSDAEIENAIRSSTTSPEVADVAIKISKANRFNDKADRIKAGRTINASDKLGAVDEAGDFSRLKFESLDLDENVIDSLKQEILFSDVLGENQVFKGISALNSLFLGQAPTRAELNIFEKQFGSGFARAIELQTDGIGATMSALNAPRAIVASSDLSAPFRQGIMLIGRPKQFFGNIKPMVKAYLDPEYYNRQVAYMGGNVQAMKGYGFSDDLIERAVRENNLATEAGLAFTGGLSGGEELFMGAKGLGLLDSSLLGQSVKRSERAYTLYLNKLRRDVFMDVHKNWEAAGVASASSAKEYAQFLNRATGRASEGFSDGKMAQYLNAAFFAPNFLFSRFLAPTSLYQASGAARKQVARDLGAFVGTGGAVLSLAYLASKSGALPGFSIEGDPRSSDFGKLRYKDTRWDFWGGYQQIARNTFQTISGQRKTSSGDVVDAERLGTIGRFFQSKLSPQASIVYDSLAGKTFLGDEITSDVNSIADNILLPRFAPLALQDVTEGLIEGGAGGGARTIPAVFGVGVTTYSSFKDTRNRVASDLFGTDDFGDLTGTQQRAVDQHPDVIAKSQEFDAKVGSNYTTARNAILEDQINAERAFMAQLVSGIYEPGDFADAIGENDLRTSVRRDQAFKDFGLSGQTPSSNLQVAVNQWRELYKKADVGADFGTITGQVDWELFGELESELFKRLTAEERNFIEERRRADHDPTVQWFYNNKDYINDTGYFGLIDDAFNRFKSSVQRSFPEVNSLSELEAIRSRARLANDRATEGRVSALISRIRKVVDSQRERMRKRDPKLDAALWHNGYTTVVLTNKARKLLPATRQIIE